jgi:NAD(P)-dependent dehydrogenase (short-subunit alcohol dehydrogenase family)
MWANTAVVTGGTAGVGRAVSRMLAEQGVAVGVLARGREGLEGTVRDIERLGGQAVAVSTDVADPQAVEAAAAEVETRLGPVDLWINNAMTTVLAPVWDITPEEYRRVTEVNYLGTVNGTMAALRRMLPRDHGRIVQVGSALAQRGIPNQSAYCGSKHAIKGFTESVRTELLHRGSGVDIGIVQLPAMNTPQFLWARNKLENKPQPVPPIYQPEVGAAAVVWAAETGRARTWVAMPTVLTILGEKAAAGLLDHYLARTGVESQQTDVPDDPDRPDYVFEPVDRDHGARGPFSERATDRSWQMWANRNRASVALGGAAVVAAAWATRRR